MKIIKPFKIDGTNKKDFLELFFMPIFSSYYYFSILDFNYFVNKTEGCDLIGIYMKELRGEIVDRIKKKEGNNIKKERRNYERERNDNTNRLILGSLRDMFKYTFNSRRNVYLGKSRNINIRLRVDEGIKAKDEISDVIEEEDVRQCLLLFSRHMKLGVKLQDHSFGGTVSVLCENSTDALRYLLCSNIEMGFSGGNALKNLLSLFGFQVLYGIDRVF